MIDDADRHSDRILLWLTLIALCVAIVVLIYKFPQTSVAIIAALVITIVLFKLGVV